MKSLDQRNKTIRIAFDLIVYFRLEQHHKFWRFCISWIFTQIKGLTIWLSGGGGGGTGFLCKKNKKAQEGY